MMSQSEPIRIEISSDEALVLFEWLHRSDAAKDASFADQTEKRVLRDIQCSLESVLVAPFSRDYDSLLAQAKSRLSEPNR